MALVCAVAMVTAGVTWLVGPWGLVAIGIVLLGLFLMVNVED